LEPIDQRDFSILGGYQFVDQGTLYLLPPPHICLCNQYLKVCSDEFFVINFIIFVLSRFRANMLAENSSERTTFDIWKSSNFLPGIITLVISVNITASYMVLIVEGRSFMYIMKSKGPRIDP
jgi:hypothetical protein